MDSRASRAGPELRASMQFSDRRKQELFDAVDSNRITFVFGPTGCGKSSQVPKLLLQHCNQPVLCTQPRRLAAIAIALRVSQEMSCPIGETVGFHVGCNNISSVAKTRLLFSSTGMLLEYFRSQGTQVHTDYADFFFLWQELTAFFFRS
jgi:HrpA-like RNA helicase